MLLLLLLIKEGKKEAITNEGRYTYAMFTCRYYRTQTNSQEKKKQNGRKSYMSLLFFFEYIAALNSSGK